MTIEFCCPDCDQTLRVPDEAAGKRARCPECNAVMAVPHNSPVSSSPSQPLGAPAGNPLRSDTAELNPYASPAALEEGLTQQFTPAASQDWPGLPWDYEPWSVASWKATAILVMLSPGIAFAQRPRWQNTNPPFSFAWVGVILGFLAIQVWQIPLQMLTSGKPPFGLGVDPVAGVVVRILFVSVVGFGVCLPIGLFLSLSLNSVLQHIALRIAGVQNSSFEVTFRVNAYAQGAVAWLAIIPFVGQLVSFVWALVVTTIGLSKAHNTTLGKALCATLVPMLMLFGLGVALALALLRNLDGR